MRSQGNELCRALCKPAYTGFRHTYAPDLQQVVKAFRISLGCTKNKREGKSLLSVFGRMRSQGNELCRALCKPAYTGFRHTYAPDLQQVVKAFRISLGCTKNKREGKSLPFCFWRARQDSNLRPTGS